MHKMLLSQLRASLLSIYPPPATIDPLSQQKIIPQQPVVLQMPELCPPLFLLEKKKLWLRLCLTPYGCRASLAMALDKTIKSKEDQCMDPGSNTN